MKKRSGKLLMSEINVVPYIDVMLVLLIIFMVTAPLLTAGVQVELPRAPANPITDEQEPVVFTVALDGECSCSDGGSIVYFDNQTVSTEEILRRVRAVLARNPDLPIWVRGDGRVAYSEVVEFMVLLQQAGVDSVRLVTDPTSHRTE